VNKKIIERLSIISPEEQFYLKGNNQVIKNIYTTNDYFEVDSKLLLREGKIVTVRPHSRFVEFPAHKHNYIEIMYVCQGSITHYIEGKELVMNTGDILLLNQNVKHGIKKANFEDIGINFIALPEFFDIPVQMLKEHNIVADFIVNTLKHNNTSPQYLLFQLKENEAIENLMENMIYSLITEVINDNIINKYSMGLVFLYLINNIDLLNQNSSKSYKDMVIQSTIKYINTNYKNANLNSLAKELHQSLSVLSKMIKQTTGHTFQEHLMRKRFQKSVMFLVETDLPIEEIAYNVGYENLSYFYRQFKERYGMTPRQYRIKHKNDDRIKI